MLGRSWLAILLLGSLMACSLQPKISHSIDTNPSLEIPSATSIGKVTPLPTKTTTIQIEGQSQQIPIERVQTPNFSTYYPSDRFLLQRGGGSGEGEGTWFYWKQPSGAVNKNAYVQVFFPGTNLSVSQVRQLLIGDRGIVRAKGWRTVPRGSGDSYGETAYSAWLRDFIPFEPRTKSQTGAAYIGEVGGRAFYVISYYPREYGDGFTPRADVILKNISGKGSQLSRTPQLTLKGIGDVRIGMTVAQASTALGRSLISQGEPAPGSSCRYVAPAQPIPGLNFMAIDDRIVRIDVRKSSPITTISGAKIGDSEARIKQLYPGQIAIAPHKYRPNGHYLTFVPKDTQDKNYRLIFETDGKQVTDFRSGRLPEVNWVEGCS